MQKFYLTLQAAFWVCLLIPIISKSQNCSTLTATAIGYESRCAATGSIKIFASGGSGSYKYKVTGTFNSNFTSTDSITGLPPGTYNVIVNDINTSCEFQLDNVDVAGSYQDPRFTLINMDVSCDNGNNGTITVTGQQYGRPPFAYSIVAPSAMGIGTNNTTGVFNNLKAGDYSIRMTDSCGGIQTRQITVDNYTWLIDSYVFTKTSCGEANGFIKVIDSRGNISTIGGIPGFMYGVVRLAGDTIWSSSPNFVFDPLGAVSLDLVAKDQCNKIKKAFTTISFIPSVGATIKTNNNTCSTFTAAVTKIKNFFDAEFCLYDTNNILVACNSTGVFTGLAYGSYCIAAHDSCSDTTITRCFTETPPVISVSNNVNISDRNCNFFTATITGKTGLTNADYCLYDSSNILLDCNRSGIFDSLAYGSYCIQIKDGCVDTTLTRCFTVLKPRPRIPDVIEPAYTTCDKFGIIIGGDSLYNPRFCLLDSNGIEIICNNTGIFDSLSFGDYCISIYDSCYDTTIVRCLSVLTSYITNDISFNIDNKACSTFTVTAVSTNIIGGQYCLYTAADSLIACNTSGVFDSVLYGAYCVKTTVTCPDTSFVNCFSVTPPEPSVGATVGISNRTCNFFKASITGNKNLSDPQYCLFDSSNAQIACNTTGVFDSLAYGSYCIKIVNSCYDSTIVRCFAALPVPLSVSLNLKRSCKYGYAKFTMTLTDASYPVNLSIYKPSGDLYLSASYNTSIISVDSIPEITGSDRYRIIITDKCGAVDSLSTAAIASKVTHSAIAINKCPSAAWLNGSGSIQTTTFSNMGAMSVRIIKKNGATYNPYLNPNTSSGGVFTFNELGPGTYIVRYKASDGCNKYLYDTVTIQPYLYPSLNRTSAYQCDSNGFTLGAVVDFGVGPFSYEIIGSTPASPSIITAPQPNPVFTINNGTTYSLIRLRVLDACGNASLEDASILPLADNSINVTFNCFQNPTTLSIDSVTNATYAWYMKEKATSTDSVYLGSASSVYIPSILPSDTGIYSCYVEINSGCIKRTYQYNLDASCYKPLPVVLKDFAGNYEAVKIKLNWKMTQLQNLQRIIIERKSSGRFITIGTIANHNRQDNEQAYSYTDTRPEPDDSYYRLKIVRSDNSFFYSDVIHLAAGKKYAGINIYPNPANDIFTVQYTPVPGHQYKIKIVGMLSQLIQQPTVDPAAEGKIVILRQKSMANGMYMVQVTDITTGKTMSQKIILR